MSAELGAERSATPAEPRRVAVLGIGNTLMRDDGVGVEVARRLIAGGGLPEGCEVVLGETAGMGLVRYFREFDGVVFVDAIDAGDEPGSVFSFHPDDAGVTSLRSNSIHGMGVGYLLTCARMTGANPDVVVVAIQVGDVRPVPDTLSAEVASVVPRVVEIVCEEVERLSSAIAV